MLIDSTVFVFGMSTHACVAWREPRPAQPQQAVACGQGATSQCVVASRRFRVRHTCMCADPKHGSLHT